MGERWFLYSQHRPFPGDHRRMGGPPGLVNERLLERLGRHLNLTEDQRVAIAQILRDSREEIEAVRRKVGDDMRTRENKIQEEISAILTPEQREKFNKSRERRRSSRRRKDGRPSPQRGY